MHNAMRGTTLNSTRKELLMKRSDLSLLTAIALCAASSLAGAHGVNSTSATDSSYSTGASTTSAEQKSEALAKCDAKGGYARKACIDEAEAGRQGSAQAQPSEPSDRAMQSMTKEEESKSMPLPGQANDHSTVTKDAGR